MKAEILSIGTELLVGSILNTNARFLSQELAFRGVDVYHQHTVGDNVSRLREAIDAGLGRADIVICSGGLGPTEDDVTMEAAALALGVPRLRSVETVRRIRKRLRQARLPVGRLSLNQTLAPKGATLFQNQFGTAPGIFCKTQRGGDTKYLILLPGPPKELEPMFIHQAWPILSKSCGETAALHLRSIKISGLTETQVAEKVGPLLKRRPPVTCGIYAKIGVVELKIMSKAKTLERAKKAAKPVETFICRVFGQRVFGFDEDTLPSSVLKLLRKKKLSLSLAESCTGGLASHLLTSTPGISEFFKGSLVAYSNQVKNKILGVSAETLKKHGAVSAPCAYEMALAAQKIFQSSIGLSITGIAGPGGGSTQKPVGLVYIALSKNKQVKVTRHFFSGSRDRIQQKAALSAIDLLRLSLLK